MASRGNWRSASRCRTSDAEDLFVTGRRQREAREFCRICPVRTECLAYALDQRIEFGVWGGMTERERRALLRQRPDVTSWADVLSDARARHDASLLQVETVVQVEKQLQVEKLLQVDVLTDLTDLTDPRLHRTA